MAPARILVVFYSRTGRTRVVAEAIAQALNADIEEIREEEDRSGLLGFLRSACEAVLGKPARIKPASRNPEEYDLVVAGSPVWAGRLSSPMRAYLALYGRNIRRIAFFSTCGINEGRIFKDMEELSGKPAAALRIKNKEIMSGKHLEKIREFVNSLSAPSHAA